VDHLAVRKIREIIEQLVQLKVEGLDMEVILPLSDDHQYHFPCAEEVSWYCAILDLRPLLNLVFTRVSQIWPSIGIGFDDFYFRAVYRIRVDDMVCLMQHMYIDISRAQSANRDAIYAHHWTYILKVGSLKLRSIQSPLLSKPASQFYKNESKLREARL